MENKSDYREPDGDKLKENEEISETSDTSWQSDDVEWDGTESELILEDDTEEYEENQTGIKLKYVLTEEEISEIFKHTEGYQKNRILQRNQTIIHSLIFVALLCLWIFLKNTYYAFLLIFPVACILALWIVPIFSIKRLAKDFFSGEEISVEIYPDKITASVRESEREILLDGTSQYEIIANQMIIYPKQGNALIIPIRAVDPEFLPDIQAMIVAGTNPKEDK